MFWYNVISHNSSYYFKMCISEKTKKKIKYKENILKAAREKQQNQTRSSQLMKKKYLTEVNTLS